MKVQILIAALVTIASSAPAAESPADTESIALFTRAINDVLAGLENSSEGLFVEHRARIPSPHGFSIRGDVLFNGSKIEVLGHIWTVTDGVTIEDKGVYQRIRCKFYVHHYKVTSNVTFNVTRHNKDTDRYHSSDTIDRIVWGVESIVEQSSPIQLSFYYFKNSKRVGGIEFSYRFQALIPKMHTTLKYSTDHGWPELGVELEPYVKRYFDQTPTMLLTWLRGHFQNLKLE